MPPPRRFDPFAEADGPQRRAPRAEAEAVPRRLAAVLRWRTRWLLRQVPPGQARAIRFLPATLQTSFPFPGLREEPPGIEGTRVGRKWAALAGTFGLPPPSATRRGRRVVAALLVSTREDGLDGWAIVSPEAGNDEIRRLRDRVDRINKVLGEADGRIRLVLLDPLANPAAVQRLVAFGALIAGRLPESFWPAGRAAGPLDAEALCRLAIDAPSPLAGLTLALRAAGTAPHPATQLFAALEEGLPARALADPELFCGIWAGKAAGREADVLRAIELTSRSQTSRRTASKLREPDGPALPARGRQPGAAARAFALGRTLALEALRAASRAPSTCRAALRRRLRRELVEPGAPVFLLPAIGKGLAYPEIGTPGELPEPVRERGAQGFTVVDGAGAPLARGSSPDQARLRALALGARAMGRAPVGFRGEPAWRWLAEALVRPPERRTVVFAVEPAEAAGPPFDPLNRGPERRLAFGDSLVVTLRPGHRPTARRLRPEILVDRLVGEALAGASIELMAASGAAQPAAARLHRLIRQAAGRRDPQIPLAVEAGGRILVFGERVRRFDARRFAARPVRCFPDPEAPDLGVGQASLNATGRGPKDTIECLVTRAGLDRAAVIYVDERGWLLREEVPLAALEAHLRETQAILRAPPRPTALAVRVAAELEAAMNRLPPSPEIVIDAGVLGELPFGLAVELHGERFGAGEPLGWRAAALTALSTWPPGVTGRIRVKAVAVDVHGLPASGLLRLHARCVAVRRMEAQIRSVIGLKG